MKSLVFYVTVMMLIALLIMLIKKNEVIIEPKIITVAQSYSYLSQEDQKMEVPIYLNLKNHPLSEKESYMSIYFSNFDETKKIQMHLEEIQYGHVETYLDTTYHQYALKLELPFLDHLFIIEDLYMHIELVNGDLYTFYLGSFSLIYVSETSKLIDWTGLNGMKAENSFLSRLSEIYIDFESMTETISQIEIGGNDEVSFTVLDHRITLNVIDQAYLLNDVPIIIYFSNNKIQTIPNFKYMIDYQVLKESGPLIYTYAAD